jgi:hypothetical protein
MKKLDVQSRLVPAKSIRKSRPHNPHGFRVVNVTKSVSEERRDALLRTLWSMDSHNCLEWVIEHWNDFLPEEQALLLLEAWNGTNLYMSNTAFPIDELVEKFREVGVISDFDPPQLTFPLLVYRGCVDPSVPSMAWTTDQSIAEKFAKGLHRPMMGNCEAYVMKARCVKSAILGFCNERDESEVILCPSGLRNVRMIDVIWRTP